MTFTLQLLYYLCRSFISREGGMALIRDFARTGNRGSCDLVWRIVVCCSVESGCGAVSQWDRGLVALKHHRSIPRLQSCLTLASTFFQFNICERVLRNSMTNSYSGRRRWSWTASDLQVLFWMWQKERQHATDLDKIISYHMTVSHETSDYTK